jgi:large subunit ribosomal protein L44
MGYAQKKLVSTAAKITSISTSHLKKFPPKESLYNPPEGDTTKYFNPPIWAALQPPPPSALSAFAHRIGLSSILTTPEIVLQVCTHLSFIPLHEKYYPRNPSLVSNDQLATVGNTLMGLFASEHLHASFQHLPTRVLKAAVSAHVGPMTCASIAQEMGATPLLRWHRTVCANL